MMTVTFKLPEPNMNAHVTNRGRRFRNKKEGMPSSIRLTRSGAYASFHTFSRSFRTLKQAVRFRNSIYRQLGVPIPKDEPRP